MFFKRHEGTGRTDGNDDRPTEEVVDARADAIGEQIVALRGETDLDAVQIRRRVAAEVPDVFLFPTLYRFDAVYHIHFKCNVHRLIDFDNFWDYARDIYQMQCVADTCNMGHVKAYYYRSHDDINPERFVPAGPETDWSKHITTTNLQSGTSRRDGRA